MSKEEFLKKARDMDRDVEYEYKKENNIRNGTEDRLGDDHSIKNRDAES